MQCVREWPAGVWWSATLPPGARQRGSGSTALPQAGASAAVPHPSCSPATVSAGHAEAGLFVEEVATAVSADASVILACAWGSGEHEAEQVEG